MEERNFDERKIYTVLFKLYKIFPCIVLFYILVHTLDFPARFTIHTVGRYELN